MFHLAQILVKLLVQLLDTDDINLCYESIV